ncbi:MAG: zf-HC2 domain-containing protein [Elusimicrobia bacterium]|nr:zf-HC2 domain-containing protein [Elusimicrobiota bacterium]
MTHEEIKESLSDYFDGQLGPAGTVEISAHVATCPECRAELDALSALSAGIKESLPAPAPAAMKERLLARARQENKPLFRSATVLAVAFAALILVLMAGVAAKKYMPTLFSSVQGMINGAASTLGVSGGNK